ncbi:hypothetical protein L3V79_08460 [Thiotrichales bacterium 19S9-12]|nr:hypothetical protein [Thiotrichales bacterium 19S9-11]MCF6812386.1 hypothetical protein [Thiotrichales bacterium 19S9-12]
MSSKFYFGDLHANALKLLLVLEKAGYITNLQDYYEALKAAYVANDINTFIKICNEKLNFERPEDPNSLCFMGDTLSDRGMNDLFTLLIFNLMAKNKVDFEIAYSNHDAVFVRNLAKIRSLILDQKKEVKFDVKLKNPDKNAKSLRNFIEFLKNRSDDFPEDDILSNKNLIKYINNYLDHLKIAILDDNHILSTHAPLNEEITEIYFKKEGQTLKQVIEASNLEIKKLHINSKVSIKKLNKTKSNESKPSQKSKYLKFYEKYNDLTWNRKEFSDAGGLRKSFGLKDNKYIFHLHGHDKKGLPLYLYSMNLDNINGKFEPPEDLLLESETLEIPKGSSIEELLGAFHHQFTITNINKQSLAKQLSIHHAIKQDLNSQNNKENLKNMYYFFYSSQAQEESSLNKQI